MQLKYNQEAERKGIYIVGSCGFDSIPSDLGQSVVMRAMDGPVNTIETYLKCTSPPDEPGAIINFATYQCAIYGFAMAQELIPVRYYSIYTLTSIIENFILSHLKTVSKKIRQILVNKFCFAHGEILIVTLKLGLHFPSK